MSEIAVSTLAPHQAKIRLKVYLAEYDKLKSEQAQRIGLRDNLVYAMLVATAAVFHFSLQQKSDAIGLLALTVSPFVSFQTGTLCSKPPSAGRSGMRI